MDDLVCKALALEFVREVVANCLQLPMQSFVAFVLFSVRISSIGLQEGTTLEGAGVDSPTFPGTPQGSLQ